MEINKEFKRKAIIAGINFNKTDTEFNVLIEETVNLCKACNIEVIDKCIQKSRNIDPNTAFRKGKLLELAEMVKENNVDCVIFYNNLSVSTIARISETCMVEIIDRTGLILDIFSIRAKTREAIIQTQMARLKYALPKLFMIDFDADRQRGGTAHNRGGGETKIEAIKRKIENQIGDLKKELRDLKTQNKERAKKRINSNLKTVALVGYTNAGKSSLMNCILRKNNKSDDKLVFQKDMLFATLDTSIRNISYKTVQFLLFDTVGFVSDLPHELIEAFQSTLNAVNEADLLIHVIDAGDPLKEVQKEITYETLKTIKANNIPVIEVYNKSDKILEKAEEYRYISCKNEEGIDELLEEIVNKLYPKELSMNILLPYEKMYLLDKYKSNIKINKMENNDSGSLINLSLDGSIKEVFKAYKKNS